MSWSARILLAIVLGGVVRAAPARAEPADTGTNLRPGLVDEALLGGRHWRLESTRGPIHVWVPPGYDGASAGIVIYVHGYRTDVNHAWIDHHLAEQFLASKQNALFIAVGAPESYRERVSWPSLGRLLSEVRKQTHLARPWGHVVAIGHSGAYRTILCWLDYRPLDHVILLDGMYGHEDEFDAWMKRGRGQRKLILVGADTLRWTEPFVREHPKARAFDFIPEHLADIPEARRKAPLLYLRSQFDHMGIVEEGKTIPLLLRLSGLPGVTADEIAAEPMPAPRIAATGDGNAPSAPAR